MASAIWDLKKRLPTIPVLPVIITFFMIYPLVGIFTVFSLTLCPLMKKSCNL